MASTRSQPQCRVYTDHEMFLTRSATDAPPTRIRSTDVKITDFTLTIIVTLLEKKMTSQQQITLFITDVR